MCAWKGIALGTFVVALGGLSGCGAPVAETSNPLYFLLIAEEHEGTTVKRFEDTNGTFFCDELPTPATCPAVGYGYSYDSTSDGGATTPGGGDGCRCLGQYHLRSTSGMEIVIKRNAVAEGLQPDTASGQITATYQGTPGVGFVAFSRVEQLRATYDYYFLDVAGGFEMSFGGATFVKGAFYSLDRNQTEQQ